VLSDGRWLEVDNNFCGQIVAFTENALHEEPFEPAYGNIDISDNDKKK
jgi:hypothetical protein